MAEYLIGDIHGHYGALKKLTKAFKFDPKKDTLHFVGDLINGGKQDVEVIEFIMELENAVVTLGNHDLSALAVFYGTRRGSSKSSISDLLEHPNATQYFNWLRHQKLVYQFRSGDLMVHAGIASEWGFEVAIERARAVERRLQAADPSKFLTRMFQPAPNLWADCLTRKQKDVYAVNAFTRQRALYLDGTMDFGFKSTLKDMPNNLTPWFTYRFNKLYRSLCRTKKGKVAKYKGPRIYFGHWSALGYHKDICATCLDSGVRWGGPLTAIRLHDQKVFQEKD